MRRYSVAAAVILCLAALACGAGQSPREKGASSEVPSTPLPAATALPVPTSILPTATLAEPMTGTRILPPLEAPPAPPAVPVVSIEYGGSAHQGRQGSYCWPVTANSSVCVDKIGWEDFDNAPAMPVKRGDGLSVVVNTDEPDPGEVYVQVFTVDRAEPFLVPGDEVYSAPAWEGTTLDLEPGLYFLSAFYKSPLGDASYGFKVEVVD